MNNKFQFSTTAYRCPMCINIDTYSMCPHDCAYCFAHTEFHNATNPRELANILDVAALERSYLREKDIEHTASWYIAHGFTAHCGCNSDPWSVVNRKYHVTNQYVNFTNRHDILTLFCTKGISLEDANIRPTHHMFQFTVTSADPEAAKRIEPGVPPLEKRLELFKYLKANGFKVGIRIQPVIDSLGTIDIIKMFEGADHYTFESLKLTLPADHWTIPELVKMRQHRAKHYLLSNVYRHRLLLPLVDYCRKHGLSYAVSDNDMRYLTNNKVCCGDCFVGAGLTGCSLHERIMSGAPTDRDSVFKSMKENLRGAPPPMGRHEKGPNKKYKCEFDAFYDKIDTPEQTLGIPTDPIDLGRIDKIKKELDWVDGPEDIARMEHFQSIIARGDK